MVLAVGAVWVIGWFLLSISGGFTLVAMVRGKATYVQIAGPFLLLVGLPVYFSGGYLHSHVEDLSPLLCWIPGIVGAICGAIAGYGVEDSA
jgi:hypothetical protein